MKAVEGITGKEIITFGINETNDYYATNIKKITGMQTSYTVMHKGNKVCDIQLMLQAHIMFLIHSQPLLLHYVNADIESIQRTL